MATESNSYANREISQLHIDSYTRSLLNTPHPAYFGELYSTYICGNQYRQLKDRNGNWIKNVEDVFGEIVFFIMKKGEQDAYVYLYMEDSAIGRESKSGYAWQKLSEDQKWRIITFNRILYNNHVKDEKKKSEESLPDYMRDTDSQDKVPEFPKDQPLNDALLLVKVHRELGKRIVREERNRMIVFIGLCSAYLLFKPLGCVGKGASSVGKNMVFDTVINHFPEILPNIDNGKKTGWFLCNNIKEAALFRLDMSFTDHTIFYLGEMPDSMSETQKELYGYLRQLQSEGRIAKTLSEQVTDEDGNKNWVAMSYHLEANISFFALSVFDFEEQFGNRQIKLSFDESEAQTNRIADWKTEIQMYATTKPEIYERTTKSKYIMDLIYGLDIWYFKQYEGFEFENPYAIHVNKILKKLYSGSIQLRRVTDYVFRFIEVITRLHSRHRVLGFVTTGKGGDKIIATAEDNLIGLYLLWNSLEQAILDITQPDKEILNLMKEAIAKGDKVKLVKNQEWEEGEWFTSNQMRKAINRGSTAVRDACKRLSKVGYIKVTKGNTKGSWWKYNLSETDSAPNSVEPFDFMPFFLPKGVTTILSLNLLKNSSEWCDSRTFFEMPILASIFNEPLLYYCTDIISIYIYYKYIVRGGLENSNSKNNTTSEEILLAYESNNTHHKGLLPDFREHLEIQEKVLRKWVSGIAIVNGSTEFASNTLVEESENPMSELNPQNTGKISLSERIRIIIENDTIEQRESGNHISTIEIKEEINKRRTKKINSDKVREICKKLMGNGDIYEPVPDLWGYNL